MDFSAVLSSLLCLLEYCLCERSRQMRVVGLCISFSLVWIDILHWLSLSVRICTWRGHFGEEGGGMWQHLMNFCRKAKEWDVFWRWFHKGNSTVEMYVTWIQLTLVGIIDYNIELKCFWIPRTDSDADYRVCHVRGCQQHDSSAPS